MGQCFVSNVSNVSNVSSVSLGFCVSILGEGGREKYLYIYI